MTQNDDIGIATCGTNGIGEALAFVHRRELNAIADGDDITTEASHGSLEGHIGAGTGFKKEGCHDFACTYLGESSIMEADAPTNGACGVDEGIEVIAGELVNGDNVFAHELIGDFGGCVGVPMA